MITNFIEVIGGLFRWVLTNKELDKAVEESKSAEELLKRAWPILAMGLMSYLIARALTKNSPKKGGFLAGKK